MSTQPNFFCLLYLKLKVQCSPHPKALAEKYEKHEIAKYFLIFKHSPVKEFARSAFLHVL